MQPVLIFDLETDGLLDAVTKIHLLVTRDLQTGHAEVYRGDTIPEGIKALQTFQGLLVGHNAIKYDHPVLTKLHPDLPVPIEKVQDSMVLSRLIHPDLWDTDNKLKVAGRMAGALMNSHSLKAWGIRLGLHKGDYAGDPAIVDEKVRRETMWASWNQAMEDYCLQDTAVTAKLWVTMNKSPQYPGTPSVELEHTVARILARQERQGFLFDIKQAEKLYVKLAVIREQLRTNLTKTFPPWWTAGAIVEPLKTISYRKNPMQAGTCAGAAYQRVTQYVFNPSSRMHIANRLKARHGWVPTEFTDGGEPKIDETVLATMPWLEARELEEYFLVDKRIGAIAEGKQSWLKQVAADQRVHGSVNPNGAVTGRMTHSNPNMGQTPSATSLYGKECRALFIVPPGKKLVGCDADALELRDLAGFMAPYDDGAYIKTILEGKKELGTDMHSVNCRGIGLEPKTKYFGEETGRDIAKTWFYAFIYGAGDAKLGFIVSRSRDEKMAKAAGAKSRKSIMEALPAMGKLIKAVQHATNQRKGFLKGLDGRYLKVRSAHAALNTLLQSAGALQMKMALVILDRNLQEAGMIPGVNYEFVANVHDEWQIETDEALAETVGKLAADAIGLAGVYFNFKCPLAGNYVIGNNWAETH